MSKKKGTKNNPDSSDKADEKEILTVEEHKKNLNISAPVFAAVMMTRKWGSGKRVPETEFKDAVEEFLGAPMDGVKEAAPAVEEGQEEKPDDGLEGGE